MFLTHTSARPGTNLQRRCTNGIAHTLGLRSLRNIAQDRHRAYVTNNAVQPVTLESVATSHRAHTGCVCGNTDSHNRRCRPPGLQPPQSAKLSAPACGDPKKVSGHFRQSGLPSYSEPPGLHRACNTEHEASALNSRVANKQMR